MTHQLHQSDPTILNRRTLERHHPMLGRLLRPGMRILDVGCGTGAITADIAKAVSPGGAVVGLDRDAANLAIAQQERGGVNNLTFQIGDVLDPDFDAGFEARFDLVTTARVLLWISEPVRALEQMKKVVVPGGRIVVLDYSIADTKWEPEPPSIFRRFFDAFLQWRTANGWDNSMAKHLPEVFESAGLVDIEAHRTDDTVQRGEAGFFEGYASGVWIYVIKSVGPKLVAAGFFDEGELNKAEDEYARYVETSLERQSHFALTVEGVVPAGA